MYGLNGYLHYTSMGDAAFSATKAKDLRDGEGNRITMKKGHEVIMGAVIIREASISLSVKRGNYPKNDRVEVTIEWEGWHDEYGDIQGSTSMKEFGFMDLDEFLSDVAMYMEDSSGDSPMQ